MNDKIFSSACNFLRLPLMLLVVFIHVKYNVLITLPKTDLSYSVVFFFTQIISRIAVPSFFVISGYYFFFDIAKQNSFSLQDYKTKLSKRVFSLLIPYLIWNLFYCLFKSIFFEQNFFLLLSKIFAYPMPVAFQFWYIRDLMIMCLISPLLYWLIKKIKWFLLLILLLVWFLNLKIVIDTPLLFFSLGAYFSIERKNVVSLLEKIKPYVFLFVLFFGVMDFVFNLSPTNIFHKAENIYLIHCLFILSGVAGAFCFAVYFVKNKQADKFSNSSLVFLLFAIHPLTTLYLFTPLLITIFGNEISLLVAYFVPIIFSIVVAYILYCLMNKFFRHLLFILVGRRK